jgi:pilus retraction protein PilT
MSQLDIAERRLPQGGRFLIRMQNREMDFRISLIPTLFGEKVVMRLLDKAKLQLDLTKLGFEPDTLEIFRESIYRPYGMILVTGPTGSGKTTTLYSVLSELNKVSENICTCEDPIEYNLPGVNQVQMHEAIGLNFAASLREFLRQDPDIILVGEMRDKETIDIAIKAAETGHLVLSTVHTTDAPRTISRILSVFDPSEQASARLRLSETLLAVISQRLLQRADGSGRVVACEIMRQTKTIQECIADPEKIFMLKEYIEKGQELHKMQTFDRHLSDLYRQGTVSLETAKSAATSASDFERNLTFQ